MNKLQIKKSQSSYLDKLKKPKPVITIWHKLLFLSPILITLLIFKGNEWYNKYQLSYHGAETMATIKIVSFIGVRDPVEIENVAFEFNTGDSIYTGYTNATTNNNYVIAGNGLPLSVGDEYLIRFVKYNPDIYKIDYDKPSARTMLNYIKTASEILFRLNYFSYNKNQQSCCFCLSKNIFHKYGFDGLAKILFHNEAIVENLNHNSITFNNLMRNKEVKKIVIECTK
jgi:hypothetical protein